MKISHITNRDTYYTQDHEWVDFLGTIAYAGVCTFKLTGFKQIQKITFDDPQGYKKQGDIIAKIKYNEYEIPIHMPVTGTIIDVNERLIKGNPNFLLDCAETTGWIIRLAPSLPYERKDLLLPKQYQMNGKGKYAK